MIAGVKLAGGTINIAVASQAIFFFLGFIFLKIADGKERRIVERRKCGNKKANYILQL